jgi:putative endonuclease
MYTVYVLYSEISKKFYRGYTSDLKNRLLSHHEFGTEWTAKYRPWKLIFSKSFVSKRDAMKFEKWLKSGSGRDYIKKLNEFL